MVLSCVSDEAEVGKAARAVIIGNGGIATFLVLEVGEGADISLLRIRCLIAA